jgi:predicted secreted Zn-dependent protease
MGILRLFRGWPVNCWRGLLAAVLLGSLSSQAFAGVRSSTTYRSYMVGGTSASSLVSYMRSRPLAGDHGPAMANIRPSYALSVATRQAGGVCRASSVTLNIRFVMTLPAARTSSMSSKTRAAWNSFVAFARRHENTHRSIYLGCANSFVATAERMTAVNCGSLQAAIRGRLAAEQRACEARHRAFDRSEAARARGLSLFRLARS